jgi:hypothetical protein
MNSHLVFSRSAKGIEELDTRRYKLSAELRRVLILVDGHSTVGDLHKKALVFNDLEYSLESLSRHSFINACKATNSAVVGSGQHRAREVYQDSTKWQLVDLARRVLGEKQADVISKKILTTDNSKEELKAAFKACVKLIRLTMSEEKADSFFKEGLKLIN